MKTLEFKLKLNQSQQSLVDRWLDDLRWVWNQGLSLLEESQQRKWEKKHGHKVPQGLCFRWRNGRARGAGIQRSREGFKYCPIRQHQEIEDTKKLFNSSSYYNKLNAPNQKDIPWAPRLVDIPSKFRTGVHKSLAEAWKNYQDPKHPARRPKFKGKKDALRSLANYNAGGKSKELKPIGIPGTDNGYVQFPVIGKLYVKGLYKRFNPNQPYGVAKIVKKASGYYLQVAIASEPKLLKPNDKLVGIDPGVAAIITNDAGKQIRPANLLKKQLKRLRRLQKKASRRQKGSASQKRVYEQVARLNEKVKRSRSAFNHKLSRKLVDEYGAIAFEGSNLQNMIRAPKAKRREDGKGYLPNGAKAKAGLNRALSDAAWGDLRAKTQEKAKAGGREYVATEPRNSSITCSKCGCADKESRRSQKDFACVACGYTDNADANASKNHLLNSGFLETGRYRTWEWVTKVTRNSSVEEVQLTTEGERNSKRSKKQVSSPAAGTRPKGEKRSRKEMPSEAAHAPQKRETFLAAPMGEITHPTRTKSLVSGNQEVYGEEYGQDTPQNLAPSLLEGSDATLKVVENDRDKVASLFPELITGTVPGKKNKPSGRKKRLSDSGNETCKQLSLWDLAPETG